jgi:hypothetical protein
MITRPLTHHPAASINYVTLNPLGRATGRLTRVDTTSSEFMLDDDSAVEFCWLPKRTMRTPPSHPQP